MNMELNEEERSEAQSAEHSAIEQNKKRFRRKSLRRQLHTVVDQLERAAQDPQQKSAKRVDALLRQSEVLMKLQEMDKEEANQTLQDERVTLEKQHAADTQRIQELEAQSAELKRDACLVKTVTVPDPEHEKTRQQCETLKTVVKFLAGIAPNKEQAAVRAVQQLNQSAAVIVCDAVGINYREYAQYLITYKTERDLLNIVERAYPDADTSLLRFCRAVLAVHSLNLVSPKPKSDAARLHSVQEELIERERQENADRQATMTTAWRSQMGLRTESGEALVRAAGTKIKMAPAGVLSSHGPVAHP